MEERICPRLEKALLQFVSKERLYQYFTADMLIYPDDISPATVWHDDFMPHLKLIRVST
jgi:hypothetical protein